MAQIVMGSAGLFRIRQEKRIDDVAIRCGDSKRRFGRKKGNRHVCADENRQQDDTPELCIQRARTARRGSLRECRVKYQQRLENKKSGGQRGSADGRGTHETDFSLGGLGKGGVKETYVE